MVTLRRVRELPILEAETWLLLPLARVRCPRCGPTIETLPWLDRYARMTNRFAESVARLAAVLPVQHVATWFGLSWDTVKRIDATALAARLGPVDLSAVRVIAIDEFAIQRGHRYATTVVDPTTKRVLWVGRGRAREDLRPFFALLGLAGCHALEAAAIWVPLGRLAWFWWGKTERTGPFTQNNGWTDPVKFVSSDWAENPPGFSYELFAVPFPQWTDTIVNPNRPLSCEVVP